MEHERKNSIRVNKKMKPLRLHKINKTTTAAAAATTTFLQDR